MVVAGIPPGARTIRAKTTVEKVIVMKSVTTLMGTVKWTHCPPAEKASTI